MASRSLRYSYSIASMTLGFSIMVAKAKYKGNPPETFLKMHRRIDESCTAFIDAYGPRSYTKIDEREAARIKNAYGRWVEKYLPDEAPIPVYTAALLYLLSELWIDVGRSKISGELRKRLDEIQAAVKAMHRYYDRRDDEDSAEAGMRAALGFQAEMMEG